LQGLSLSLRLLQLGLRLALPLLGLALRLLLLLQMLPRPLLQRGPDSSASGSSKAG